MLPDILYFGVEFFEGDQCFTGDLPGKLDVGVLRHEDGDDKMLAVSQVDQVLIVVKIDHCQLIVGLGLR